MKTGILLLVVSTCLVSGEGAGQPIVEKLEVNTGSCGGYQRLRIFGENFSKDPYTFGTGNENKGNKVIFTDGETQVVLETFVEDSIKSNMIVAWTKKLECERTYNLRLTVDGVDVPLDRLCPNNPDLCNFTPKRHLTPLIQKVEPWTGIPGGDFILKLTGNIVTNRTGSNEYCSVNGVCEKIMRTWSPDLCQLRDEDDIPYGSSVDEDSYAGYLKCRPDGTFVGNRNTSFLIEEKYGRSMMDPSLLRISARNQLYSVQTYTDADLVSNHEISEEGALLRLEGKYYERGGLKDSTYEPIYVRTGVPGVDCEVKNVGKDDYVECMVGKMPDELPTYFPGGRGINVYRWNDGTFASVDQLFGATSPTDGFVHFDMAQFCGSDIGSYQTRADAMLIPTKTGLYEFQLKSDYQAQLYFEGALDVESSNGEWKWGQRVELIENQSYRVTIVAMGQSSNPEVSAEDSCIQARLLYFNENKFTNAWTGNAVDDLQIFKFSSTPTQDVQKLKFSGYQPQTPKNETQTVCVEGGSYLVSLGLFNTWTEMVGIDTPAALEQALNNMPLTITAGGGKFSAISADENGQCAEITFPVPGDFEKFQVRGENLDSYTVTENNGRSDREVALMLNGRPSTPFDVTSLDQALVQAAVDSLFETRCPPQITSGNAFQDFENIVPAYGTIVNNVEAYCGGKSLMNPSRIYPWTAEQSAFSLLMMSKAFYICFAFSGVRWNDDLKVRIRYVAAGQDWESVSSMDLEPLQKQDERNPWSYGCADIFPKTDKGKLIWARLEGNRNEKFYVDAVSLRKEKPFPAAGNLDEYRLRPASPNPGEQVLIDHSEVTYDGVTEEYTVRLFPLDCGSNFSLFEVMNKQGSDPLTGDSGETQVKNSDTLLTVSRTEHASPAVSGGFRVQWNGHTKDINVDLSNMTTVVTGVKRILEGIPDIGTLDVEMSHGSTCANANTRVTFRTRPGKQESFEFVEKSLTAPPSADVELMKAVDGHSRYDPLPGDLIFELHDKPQAIPYINGIPTYCSGDCSFQWSAVATPFIDSIDKTTGFPGDELVISGGKFSETPEENVVMIGDTECITTASSTSQIKCEIGNGKGNDLPVIVHVSGLGIARNNDPAALFTYDLSITDFNPKQGSYGGHLQVTIEGNGFPDGVKVYIGGIECRVLKRTATQMKILVPEFLADDLLADKQMDLEIYLPEKRRKRAAGGVKTAGSKFVASGSNTGKINSMKTPDEPSVAGGEAIQVTGTDFGDNPTVLVGDTLIEDVTITESDGVKTLSFLTPALTPGEDTAVHIDNGYGSAVYTDSKTVPKITGVLKVTNVAPTRGSLFGGTILTIDGKGFGTNQEILEIMVGGYKCIVKENTATKIKCQITDMCDIVTVTNDGTGQAHDMYFDFDQKNVELRECDTIHWTWQTAFYVKDTNHGIYQTVSETNKTLVPGGVNSGTPTRSGQFKHTFYEVTPANEPVFMWSGQVQQFRDYSQQIRVLPKQSEANKVTVKLGGQEAKYQVSGTRRKKRAEPAPPTCSTDPAVPDNENFYFINSKCGLPKITKLKYKPVRTEEGYESTITTQSKITVQGSQFPTEIANLEVTIGDCDCAVLSNPTPTANEFVCQPAQDCTLPSVGHRKELTVNMVDFGFAQKKLSQNDLKLFFLPSIQGVTPPSGSTAGFTPVTITGTGLQNVTSVRFSNIECWGLDIVDDTQIKCLTPKTSTGPVTASVGNSFPSVCDITGTNNKCFFTYSDSYTPKVTSASPASINNTDLTTVTLIGEMFGSDTAAVTVTIGGEDCTITSVTSTTIECTINGLPAGKNLVDVRVGGFGKASTTSEITGEEVIDPIVPSEVSIHGGAVLIISGHGFYKEGTSVTVDDSTCEIQGDVTLSQILCKVPPHSANTVQVQVMVNDNAMNFPSKDLIYSETLTISDISPENGVAGEVITVTGSGFGTDETALSVDVSGAACIVQAGVSDTSLACVLSSHALGPVNVTVKKIGYGFSNMLIDGFTYVPKLGSVHPSSGNEQGGQELTLIGNGFSEEMEVTVCGEPCPLDEFSEQTVTSLVCITPPGTGGESCDVNIIEPAQTLPGVYSYTSDDVPTVTGLTPSRVGTGGGTIITLTGQGFGAVLDDISVLIEGQPCVIDESSLSDTNIECTVPPKTWVKDDTKLVVRKRELAGGTRKKRNVDTTYLYKRAVGVPDLSYIDQWSSKWTWGGEDPPGEGELVVIPAGQTILLDQDTETLEMLVIDGGKFLFDSSKESIELNAKYILIIGGGLFQIGTEEEPYLNQATITLHGHHRMPQLPVYGAKTLAIREGTADIHGKPYAHTWTSLSESAEVGANSVLLPTDDVADWPDTAEIAIATTGDRSSQHETERRTYVSKTENGDGTTSLSLEQPLEYFHAGITEEYDGGAWSMDYRAEVALLTRTVLFRGTECEGWPTDTIEKCEDGFDPGLHATQTCFQGRWGEETGSCGYGAHMMAHTPDTDSNKAKMRIAYMAFQHVGQEFQQGRYAMHSHVNGDMSESYLIGNVVDGSFNRAINIHATSNLLVDENVAFKVRGGTFFTEDGVETGNIITNNLCINTMASPSLQNDDLNAASFWITNPDNVYRGNRAVGASHMGYWFRMNPEPDGPSRDLPVHPRTVHGGIFENNAAHSCGDIGLWIFQEWTPMKDDIFPPTVADSEPAILNGTEIWGCRKGIETVDIGAIQVINSKLAYNHESNMEGVKQIKTERSLERGTGIKNSLLVGHPNAPELNQYTTRHAMVAPFGAGYYIEDVTVSNFDTEDSALLHFAIQGLCPDLCGGYNISVSNLRRDNSEDAGSLFTRWSFEGVIDDVDGSLTGSPGLTVTQANPTLPSSCVVDDSLKAKGSVVSVVKCPPEVKLLRFAFNDVQPPSLNGQTANFANQYGSTSIHHRKKRFTHKPGLMGMLVDGETTTIGYAENVNMVMPPGGGTLMDYQAMTNFSFNGMISPLTADSGVILRFPAIERPDRVEINGVVYESLPSDQPQELDISTSNNGNWFYDADGFVNVLVKGPSDSPGDYESDYVMNRFSFYKCLYTGCIYPVPALLKEPSVPRPDWARPWTGENGWMLSPEDSTTWVSAGPYETGVEGSYPSEGQDVIIAAGDWIMLTESTNSALNRRKKRSSSCSGICLGNLMIFGDLEVSDGVDFDIHVKSLVISGSLIIGTEESPFQHSFSFTIHGDKMSPSFENPNWIHGIVGPKAIANYRGIEFHGKDVGVSWTKLASTADVGATTIEVQDDVSAWANIVSGRDTEIIITTTSNKVTDTEKAVIQSVSGTTITLKDPLQYRHISTTEEVDGQTYEFRSAVGLLTRNILIQGDVGESAPMFGPRLLCSVMQELEEKNGEMVPGDVHQCYLKMSNTEMRYMGQEGFVSDDDNRAAVFILNADNTTTRPIYIRNCAFHDLYAGAIAVVGSADIEITNNVVHHTVGTGLYASSDGTVVTNNLLSEALWPGTYNGRYEIHNPNWHATVDLLGAEGYTLEGNYVVGSERIAYSLPGEEWEGFTPYSETTANWAVSNLRGINFFASPTLPAREGKRQTFSNFKFWKNEVGFYYQNADDVLVTNSVFADHKTGIWILMIGPSAEGHIFEDKVASVTDSVMLGYLSETNCADDATEEWLTNNMPSYHISGPENIDCRGLTGPAGERLAGIVFPACDEGGNKAPLKPCFATQTTNCIGGRTEVRGVTFKNFGVHGTCPRSYAIAGSPGNDDLQLPMTVTDTKMVDRSTGWEDNLMYMPRPDLRKVNVGDCVDFDCDAKGKNQHLQDTDGKFFGTPGTPGAVVPDASFMWEPLWPGVVDKRRGAGDFRLPAPALLDYLTGSYLPPREVCEKIGIPGASDDTCNRINGPTYTDGEGQYDAFRCSGIKHKMIAYESLDWDAKSRRLSPVLVQQRVSGVPYCFIVNGPQDHGCCSGYNCNKRQSLFHSLVAMNDPDAVAYIYMTSTTPDKMRFLFVNPDASPDVSEDEESCIVIGVYHTKINRPDIYLEHDDGSTSRVTPVNGRYVKDGQTERFILDFVANEDVEATRPKCTAAFGPGSNFLHRDARIVYFLLRGWQRIQMILSEQVVVSYFLPTVTEDEFFESDILLLNLAALLNVRPNKVRAVNVVASADGTRRRRSTGQQEGITITLEIGNEPADSADQVTNTDTTTLGSTIMTTCQDGTISDALAVATECEQIVIGDVEYRPTPPADMGFELPPTQNYEGGLFAVQPKIRAYNSTGSPIVDLGIKEDPWALTATIKSGTGHPDAVLGGTTTITSVEGWFNFTDLFISHAGSGYVLMFDITTPSSAANLNLTVESATFDVDRVPMTAGLYAITSDDILEGEEFSLTLDLRNKYTNERIEDITWRGHTFDVDCRLPDYNDVSTLSGNGSMTFDTSNGRAPLDGLSLSGFGLNMLECHVVSTPEEFDFYFYQKIYVLGTNQVGIPRERSNIVTVRLPGDYGSLTDSEIAQLEQMVIQDIGKKHPDVIITTSSTSAGSILITFTVEGGSINVTTLSEDLCTSIKEGQSYTIGSTTYTLDPYMTVDGQDYYGNNCGAGESEAEGLHLGYIILICVLGVLVIATIVVILLWKFKVIPKTKTHEIRNTRFQPEEEAGTSGKYTHVDAIVEPPHSERNIDNGKLVYLGRGISHEGTFTSLGGSTLYSSHVNVDMRNTPSPAPVSTSSEEPESNGKHPLPNHLLVPPSVMKGKGARLDVSPVPDNKIWKY